MGDISKEWALEAYNLIRDYCRQNDECNGCIFVTEAEDGCIFDEGHTWNFPMDWQSLELD